MIIKEAKEQSSAKTSQKSFFDHDPMMSESHYRNLVENSLDGICVIVSNKIMYLNNRFCDLLGYSPQEFGAIKPSDIVAVYERDRVSRRLAQGYQNIHFIGEHIEIDFLCKDGSIISCETAVSAVVYNGVDGIQISIKDISEQKKREAEKNSLISKFALIGEMSASIAHEIRNPMATVRGLTQLLADKDDNNREYYEIMIEELDRANKLLSDFLSLAKSSFDNYQVLDINELVQRCLDIIYGELAANDIVLETDLDKSNPICIYGDCDQLKQAIINISHNSIEAMTPGGKLIVKTRVENERVFVSFTDNGIGIPDQIKQKIMQPFYSTKSYGTGLGLSVSYKVIQDNGGDLNIESQEGKGTTVIIQLPLK